ncbi:hypothetical protein O4H52_01090 [Sphingomonadaceae bacterium G21617-S1]|nr:hypothetical protein [Sphingomonadaceae bacterium G21617-S1]
MSGVKVLGELLNASTAMLAAVPSDQIKGGGLAPGFKLNAIVVRSISKVYQQPLTLGATRRVLERVQLSGLASTYAEQIEIMGLAVRACADKRGSFGGVSDVSVLLGAAGPDFIHGDQGIFEGSQDFMVSYNEGTI